MAGRARSYGNQSEDAIANVTKVAGDRVGAALADRPRDVETVIPGERLGVGLIERGAVDDGTRAGLTVRLVDVGRVTVLTSDTLPPGKAKKLILAGAQWI